MAKERQFAQLWLELGDVPGAGSELPWGGRSPRELTRCAQSFSFTAEGMGRLDQVASHVGDREVGGAAEQLLLPFT